MQRATSFKWLLTQLWESYVHIHITINHLAFIAKFSLHLSSKEIRNHMLPNWTYYCNHVLLQI
jgi:hypothetical protein